MLKKRVVSSILLISAISLSMFVDWLLGLVATTLITLGLYEFFTMVENKGIHTYKYVGVAMGMIIPLSILLHFEITKTWELLFMLFTLLFLILMQFRRRQNTGAILDISTTIFGILYVSWFISFSIKIRYLPGGLGLLTTVLLITKLGDIGAYFIGSRFGKTPLVPRISPKKSVEGAAGGLVFSVIGALISRVFLDFSYLHLVFLGIFLGILGQLGDLSESLIKRDCQVKDSGKIIPGMGGVLDIIDSLVFTVPVFYFYISVISR